MVKDCESADLHDPGDENNNFQLTESQTRQFLEVNMDDIEDAMDASCGNAAAGRKRKSSVTSVESGDAIHEKRHPDAAAVDTVPSSGPCTPVPAHSVDLGQQEATLECNTALTQPVILVRPADDSSKKMLISPELLCTALESLPFSNVSIRDVRVNRRKGLLALDIPSEEFGAADQLLGVTRSAGTLEGDLYTASQ